MRTEDLTKFNGAGATNQSTLGRFTAEISIDKTSFYLDIDIVPDHYTGHNLIIGGELFDLAEIRLRRRQAILKELNEDKPVTATETEDVDWSEVLCINTQEDEEQEAKEEISIEYLVNKIR